MRMARVVIFAASLILIWAAVSVVGVWALAAMLGLSGVIFSIMVEVEDS